MDDDNKKSRQGKSSQAPLQQVPLESLSQPNWDVIIAGAGPAGAVCAWSLAQGGHRVLIIDKARFPRHKACGDLLIPDSLSVLEKIGLLDTVREEAFKATDMEVVSPDGTAFGVPSMYLTMQRKRFDYLLIRHACMVDNSGRVTFAHGRVHKIIPGKDHASAEMFTSENAHNPLQSRIVVLATGGAGRLPYAHGMVSKKEPTALAYRGYIRSSYKIERVIISYYRSILPGYGWIIPLGSDSHGRYLYNVGCGIPYRKGKKRGLKYMLGEFLSTFPAAVEVMKTGEGLFAGEGAPIRCGLPEEDSVINGNIVAIGEAIGTTYPFTDEGIGKAMESGLAAAGCIHKALASDNIDSLNEYPEALKSKMKPRYSGYAKAEKWLSRAWLNNYVARRIMSSKFLQERVQDFIKEVDDPGTLFSIPSLIKSYFK